jgi:hypothetical protein
MKLLPISKDLIFVLSAIAPSTCKAFGYVRSTKHSISTSLNVVHSNRRQWMISSLISSVALVLAENPIIPASADDKSVDYSKIQDLLGPNGGDYVSQYQVSGAGKRPTWLTEPTDEFKESEQKSAEFKRKNLAVSKEFETLLETVTTSPNDETTLLNALDSLRRLVKSNKGLPIGITKETIIKTCRRRKSKKYWPTTVEVA